MVNLPIVYSDKKVTPFGGMSLMKRFVDSIGIREALSTLDLPEKGSNRSYDPVHVIESFWLSIWTGASRYIHADWLRYDKTLQDIFGWEKMPSQSIYSRFFGKFSDQRNTSVFPQLQKWFFSQLEVDNITLDIDSTVITRYGNQEGSAKGYNPLKEEETLNYLESQKLNYIIATRMYPNVKNEVYGLDNWISICDGIEANQMYFKHENGKKRRYIVVRKQIDIRPNSGGKLLFEDLPGYRYSCYVTNLDLPLDAVWNVYNTRTDCENRIKELKQDFGLENFCLKDFWATEASFRFIMVAYNIMSLFRFFALQSHKNSTLRTLKIYCFALGAWSVNHSNRKVLKIALNAKRRPWLDGIFAKVENLSPPFQYSNA